MFDFFAQAKEAHFCISIHCGQNSGCVFAKGMVQALVHAFTQVSP